MAIRPDPSLPNKHTGYIACSGYGKSQALKQNPDIPRQGARVLLWDPDEDHQATRYTNRNALIRAVAAGMKSGRGFRLAWSGAVNVDAFEWWCKLAWQCLDGQRAMYLMIEELADVQPSAGKAPPMFGQLCRKARKYHGILHWTTQRSEEVSKTVFSQTGNYFIGYPNDTAPPQRVQELARLAGSQGNPVTADDLYRLQPLQFYRKKGRESERIALNYKNI